MLRTEALTRFSSQQGNRAGALVTYPEALFEKVVVAKAISSNIITIKTGDVLDTDELFEKLVNYGFERTDFVYEPGQFAVRGGILDIFSWQAPRPIRIEYFGDDIESLREFDVDAQTSVRNLQSVEILLEAAEQQAAVVRDYVAADHLRLVRRAESNLSFE